MQVPGSSYGGGLDSVVSKVEIRVSCRNLVRLDVLSESDPLVRIEQFDAATGRWAEVGRTEWQQNQKNPNFARCVPMDYYFERAQKLRFQVYDVDRPDSSLNAQDFIGETIINLGDILGSQGGTASRELKNPHHPTRKNGLIIVRAEEINAEAANSIITFRFSGTNLDKKDFFGKSDPYLEIYRRGADGQWMLVHKTEVIKKTLDPSWRPFEIDASKLCQGDFDKRLLLKVWDWDSDGGHDLIGNAETTLNEMIKGKRAFQLIEPELQRKKRGYTNSGTLHVNQVDVRRVHSFLEYIAGGCQLRLAIAIDFTASNGNPQDPKSLHYRNPSGEPNEYLKAIMAVGDIVASYDQTKQFPTYGFGAKIPPANEVSHCFHVNMNPSNPECIGIENVIGAYQHSLSYVKLSGPTNFAPIIKQVATITRQNPIQQQVYWILLMITDGVISDMERTIAEIVDASDLPFSIIIVGVGDADFKDMDALDSDDRLLRTRTGKTATRDIVQFVPFRNFKHKHYSELARATLAELPKQLTDYYKAHNIAPRPRPVVPMTQAGLQIPMTDAGLHVPQTGAGGPPQQQWGGPQGGPPPQQGGWGGPQGGPPSQWGGAPSQQGGWGGPPQGGPASQWGAPPPQQGGWGGPQGGWGAPPPQQGGWGGPQGGWGGPQQGGWGGPQQQWGGPQGGPPPQQGGWGGPQGGPPQGGPAYPQSGVDPRQAGPQGGPPQGTSTASAGQAGPAQGGQPPQGYPGSPGPTQGGYPGAAAGPSGGPQPAAPGTPTQTGQPGGPASPAPTQGGAPGQPPQGGPLGGQPPQQGGWGGPQGGTPQQGGWGGPQGGPPQQWGGPQGGPPQQGGWGGPQGGPPQQGGWGGPQGGPPQQGGWGGAPQQQWGGPQGGPQGGPPQQGGPSQAPAGPTGGASAPAGQAGPTQGGPPQQGGWGGAPQQQWGGPQGGPPQQGGWSGAPQQQWGGPQGGPPQQWGGPQGGPPQQGGWAGQPQGGWAGGAPGQAGPQGSAPAQGGAPPK